MTTYTREGILGAWQHLVCREKCQMYDVCSKYWIKVLGHSTFEMQSEMSAFDGHSAPPVYPPSLSRARLCFV